MDAPPLLADPPRRLLALLASLDDDTDHDANRSPSSLPSPSKRVIVGLAGLPGAGKSTLAARLEREINAVAGPGAMAALGMDGFHLSKAELRLLPDPDAALARRGAPWTFDAPAFARRLRLLRENAGRAPVPWPDFQHGVGDPVEGGREVAPETRLVLVEGLYLFHRADGWEEVGATLDERWYLDTPMDTAMERLAARHMASWGMSRERAEAKIAANDRLNAGIVLETRRWSDWRLPPD
jgi:pantothenate kinase